MNDITTPAAPPLPRLDRALLRAPGVRGSGSVTVPDPASLELPERAVQFGTGALLRGFVEHFLDAANRQGRFGGRVVMVGSTGSGRDRTLREQDCLYTLCTRGMQDGLEVREDRVVGVVSRALSAVDEWEAVLACARAPELSLVFSNTTEVGIALDEGDRFDAEPPRSFPGKLTRFLHERGRAFGWDDARGVVVLPCELVEDNGDRLRGLVLELAERWGLEPEFAAWVGRAVPFCNTLVDRIVPGTPDDAAREALERELGYRDALLTVAEPYRLFAIEGDEALRRRLEFADADPGVRVVPQVAPYRERKVRLLNGAHTAMVAAALLAGCRTVREAMQHPRVGPFVRRLVLEEILPGVDAPGAAEFARAVLDRFANPFVEHALFDITLQGTAKTRVRVVPSILAYAERTGRAPAALAAAFAAYLLLMRGDLHAERHAAGLPVPADDGGAAVRRRWSALGDATDGALAGLAHDALADDSLWGVDLTRVPGFAAAVTGALTLAHRNGILAALEALPGHDTPTLASHA